MLHLPEIDTAKLPGSSLVGTELARSIAQLDDISLDQRGSVRHHDAIMQVIADAKVSGFDVLVG